MCVCLCTCVRPCMINGEVSPRLSAFTLLRAIRDPPGQSVLWPTGVGPALGVCSSQMCTSVSVSLNSCARTGPDSCNHSFQTCPRSVYLLCVRHTGDTISTNLLFLSSPHSPHLPLHFLSSPPLPVFSLLLLLILSSSSPPPCRCASCQTSSRSVLHVARGRTPRRARSRRGNPACRS